VDDTGFGGDLRAERDKVIARERIRLEAEEEQRSRSEAERRRAKEEPPFIEVPVFYGTNRAKAADGVWYGVERGELRFGRCLVTVPTDRRIGTIPRPSVWTFFREKPDQHYILARVEESAGKETFSRNLREYIQNCAIRQALVFVHGFNVAFADAVYRTAQIAADLNFQGAPVLFSWPSKGTLHPLGYTHDETQARWALPDLRVFLELVAEQSGADAIHLLAHSMGNRALTEALCQIATAAAKRSRAPFNELMLTAPDIDADTFVRDIAPAMLPASARVTLYASSNDRALAFSKTVHGYPRAGESGDGLVLIDGIDTIDVSAVDTNFVGHFYYGDNRSVLADLFNLMQGQAAERRFGLQPRKKNARPYWVFQP
jgi:esterase/lipase superfamily enzyme